MEKIIEVNNEATAGTELLIAKNMEVNMESIGAIEESISNKEIAEKRSQELRQMITAFESKFDQLYNFVSRNSADFD